MTIPLTELASVVLLIYLTFFILCRKRDQQTITFCLLLIGAIIWLSANMFVQSAPTADVANTWSKIAYIGVIVIPIALCHFALDLAEIKLPSIVILAVYSIGGVFTGCFLFTDLFLSGATHYEWGYWFKAGPLHPLYLIFFFSLLPAALWLLFNKARTANTRFEKFVIKRVFWAFSIASLGCVDYLPDYGINVYPLGYVPIIVMTLILGYLVVFRGFMGIEAIDWDRFRESNRILSSLFPYQQYVEDVVAHTQVKQHESVLTIGSSLEPFEKAIRRKGASCTAIDYSTNISKTTKWQKESPGEPDRSHLPSSNQTFHKILLIEFLHLLPIEARIHALKEYCRILQPRGVLAVVVPYPNNHPLRLYASHLRALKKSGGYTAVTSFVMSHFSSMWNHLYYTTVIIKRQEVAGLVNFFSSNELFACLRQSGLAPFFIQKICMEGAVLCVGKVEEIHKVREFLQENPAFQSALPELRAILGDENVLTGPDVIATYRQSTTADARIIDAIIRPGSASEIQRVVHIANKYKIALYPISTGHNWGYGTASPVHDHNVILDLGRMNKIVEINRDLAYAVIEPGVTQGQLAQYLHDNDIPLCIDPTGAGPSCSLIGNALERGFGIGPYADHFLATCGLEIVLPDGEFIRTGFGHFENAKSAHAYKWGVGPYLDGLFTQSNFGIVTRMGLWLMPKPEHVTLCYFNCIEEDAIGPLVEAIRPLLLSNILPASTMIVHSMRALTMLGQYPWDDMAGCTPISAAVLKRLTGKKKLFAWNGAAPLYGTKEQIKATKVAIRKALKGKADKITFISRRMIRFLEIFQKPLSVLLGLNIPEVIELIKAMYSVATGTPTERSLKAPYWRNTRNVPADSNLNPANDKCGLIWFAPIVPATKQDVINFLSIVKPICDRYGFEACTGFTSINKRVFDCTFPLLYDQDNLDEVRRVGDCHRELFDECMKAGYIPYRVGISSMKMLVRKDDGFWQFVNKLKRALDPNHILSPGRYGE